MCRESIKPHGSSTQPDAITSENEVKEKKNKKKKVVEKVESPRENGMPNSNGEKEFSVAEIGNDLKPSSEK